MLQREEIHMAVAIYSKSDARLWLLNVQYIYIVYIGTVEAVLLYTEFHFMNDDTQMKYGKFKQIKLPLELLTRKNILIT